MRYLLLSFMVVLLAFSCKDEQTLEDFEIDFGYDYFPLEIGSDITYKVDSIIYDPNESGVDILNNTVYIREMVVDTFRDEIGRLSHRIERFERPNVDTTWALTDVWSAVRTAEKAERFEENLRFIKMVFPVDDGDLWNGTTHLDPTVTYPVAGEQIEIFKSWRSEVISADEQEPIGDFIFDQVTTIEIANEENLLEKRFGIEKYAEGIGLVYKELEVYNTQQIESEETPWEEKTERGFRVVMTVVDY
ncbi:MAG: hypothetical protein AB8F74_05830 [Saprospiraceae bacterium]